MFIAPDDKKNRIQCGYGEAAEMCRLTLYPATELLLGTHINGR